MSQPLAVRLPGVPQPYYFNASRWVWTGKSDLPITWNHIQSGDWQGITLGKVIKIAALFIPVFAYDLIRMAANLCFSKRTVVPQGNSLQRRNNIAMLNKCIPVEALLPIVLANLDEYTAVSNFEQTPEIQRQARGYRDIDFDDVTGEMLDRIQQMSNSERLYSEVRGLDLRGKTMTDTEFLALVKSLHKAQIHTLHFPPKLHYDTVVRALEQIGQSHLRAIGFFGLSMTEEQFLKLLPKIPNLKQLLDGPHFPIEAGFADATMIQMLQYFRNSVESVDLWGTTDAHFTELVQCPQLKKLSFHCARSTQHPGVITANGPALQLAQRGQLTSFHLWAGGFPFSTLEQVCQRCPLTELTLDLYPKQMISDQGLPRLFQHTQQLQFFRRYVPLEDSDLRALAQHCRNLTSLSLNIFPDQVELFLELLPREIA